MKFIPFIFFISSFLSAQANESFLSKYNASWVHECQGDKVYIKIEKLNVSSEGMKILDDDLGTIPIFELYSDSNGIYTKLESLYGFLATVYPIVWCRTCNAYRIINWSGRCNVCGNTP